MKSISTAGGSTAAPSLIERYPELAGDGSGSAIQHGTPRHPTRHAEGMALSGSLDKARVVDGAHVLNPGGLRMDNEFANHKLLDAVGDLALAGGLLHGRFRTHRGGHGLNNRLPPALFADADAWRMATPEPLAAQVG